MTRSDFAVLPTTLATANFHWLRVLDVRCIVQVKQLVDGYKTADRLLIGTNEMMIVCDPVSGFLLRYLRYDMVASAVWYPTLRLAAFVTEDGFDLVAVEPFAAPSNNSSHVFADGGSVTSPRDEAALRPTSPKSAPSGDRRESIGSVVGGSAVGRTVWSSAATDTSAQVSSSAAGGGGSAVVAPPPTAAPETTSSNPIRLMASTTKQAFQRLRAVTTVKRPPLQANHSAAGAERVTSATSADAAPSHHMQSAPATTAAPQHPRRVRTASAFLCDDIDSAITDAFADRMSPAPATTTTTTTQSLATIAGDSASAGMHPVTARFTSSLSSSSRSTHAAHGMTSGGSAAVAPAASGAKAHGGVARSVGLEAVEQLREGRFASSTRGVSTLDEFTTWASLLSRSRYAHGVGQRYFDVHVDHAAHLSGWDAYHVKRPENYSLPLPTVSRSFEALSASPADRLVALERYGIDDGCSAVELRRSRVRNRAYTVEETQVSDPAFVAAVQAESLAVDDSSQSSDTMSPSRPGLHAFLLGDSVPDGAADLLLTHTSDGEPRWESGDSLRGALTHDQYRGGVAAVDGKEEVNDDEGARATGGEGSVSAGDVDAEDASNISSTRRRGLTVFCAPPSTSFLALPTKDSHRPLSAPSQTLRHTTPPTGSGNFVPEDASTKQREHPSPLSSSSQQQQQQHSSSSAPSSSTVAATAVVTPRPEAADGLTENLTESFVVVDDYIPGYRRSWMNRSPPSYWSAEQRIRWWRDHSSALARENTDLRVQVDALTAQVASMRSGGGGVGDNHAATTGLGAPSMSRRQRLAF